MKLSVADSNNFFFAAVQQIKINIKTVKKIRVVAWVKTAPIVSNYVDTLTKIVKENSLFKDSIIGQF